MIGKVKKWLGIEGVKLALVLPEEVAANSGKVNGKIQFFSMNEQRVTAIKVTMIERFSRGRKTEKTTDEYTLGVISAAKEILIPANKVVEVDFVLPFKLKESEMDQMENQNILMGGLVKTVKWISGVSSTFRIEAEAKVTGVVLDPFDKKEILLK